MGKTLYLDCNSGISGDMTVACLLDLGANKDKLLEVLDTVPANGFKVNISRVKKAGIDCADFDVILDEEHENHDHDMNYLYGHEHHDHHEHDHHDHAHHDHHEHDHHDHHHHEHRSLHDVYEVIDNTSMSEKATKIAKRIFDIIAQSEAKAHGTSIDEVHFHEVGAIDSIVDIISIAVCLDDLDVDKVIVPYVCEGQGTVRCQHGILPIPVPAVSNIVSQYNIPIRITNMNGEMVTPTGAAVIAAIATSFDMPSRMQIEKTGMGAGKRNYERPSILRGMLINEIDNEKDSIYKLETNVDDSTGEMLGNLMDKLIKNGARDVNYHPVYMKKNRPAYQVNIICDKENIKLLEDIVFSETTTIGIRRIKMERTVLKRDIKTLSTKYGDVKVKECILPNGQIRRYPEYESVKALCDNNDMAYPDMLSEISRII